ncbi:MAG TPA: pyridoxamine 5'-phosphate oxidase [Longimicrobiales bacterium]|nr:pyridoxamine 5'-phosphate oxidase [Longimicrobiales bacterium]
MKGAVREPLSPSALAEDPVDQFAEWYEEVRSESDLALPNACCLATVDDEGYPEGRMVLLKDFDASGFVFYTNLGSRKGRALAARPRASLTFYWEAVRRQIRIVGDVEPVDDAEADAYWRTRPRGSQLGAWASEQSASVESREALEARFREVEARFEGEEVPRPPFWSGFRLRPRAVEFWQEAPNRLHDRFRYARSGEGWSRERLQP